MGLCRAAWRVDRAEVLRLSDGPYQQVASWDAEGPLQARNWLDEYPSVDTRLVKPTAHLIIRAVGVSAHGSRNCDLLGSVFLEP